MKLGSLFSGGKDSTYAIYLAQKQGHEVACLLSIFTKSEESHLLHYPNLQWTKLQSQSMSIPQLTINSESNETDDELFALEKLLQNAKDQFHIEGLVHGGIKSQFQKEKFESLCYRGSVRRALPSSYTKASHNSKRSHRRWRPNQASRRGTTRATPRSGCGWRRLPACGGTSRSRGVRVPL